MEREATEVEGRIGRSSQPISYALAAAVLWIGVLYGLLSPAHAHHPARMLVALAPCQP